MSQRSYLSRIISEELRLTPDHAFNLAKFWNLDSDQRDYFLALVDFERAGDPDYCAFVKSKITAAKKKYESVQERTARTALSLDAHQATYFSSWIWSAVHFLTSIPKYQAEEALAERVGLRKEADRACSDSVLNSAGKEYESFRFICCTKTGAAVTVLEQKTADAVCDGPGPVQ